MEQQKDKIQLTAAADGSLRVQAQLQLYAFQDQGQEYLLCPSLQLIDFGGDKAEAEVHFREFFEVFVRGELEKGSFASGLVAYGWSLEGETQELAYSPAVQQLEVQDPTLAQLRAAQGYQKLELWSFDFTLHF